jgi:hypothetical protein
MEDWWTGKETIFEAGSSIFVQYSYAEENVNVYKLREV